MSSVTKTLELLSHFSAIRPEIGLSQMCRIAKRDKATTYRHLQSLESAGFIEQNPVTKLYRLGPALLQLAQIREATVPRKQGALAGLSRLANATGETAHASVLSGTTLYSLVSCDSPMHGTRAIIDIATLPLHATASGICALAFGPPALAETAVANLERFTDATVTTPADLDALVETARKTGFARADQSFEAEIQGISAPIFDQTENFAGAVSVACVASRFTPELENIIKAELAIASREISRNWGGCVPDHIETHWTRTRTSALDITP
tara:strand:+ start:853 stop:1656 length:804 start_codon:yes stop_codon:yes gene_type:complete